MGVKAATRALLPVVCLVLSALPLSAQGATPAVARIEALLPGFAEELALLQSDAELRDSVDWERAVAALATWLGPVPEARMLAAFRTVLQADVGRAIRGSAGFRLVADGRDTEWSGSPFVSRDTRGDGWATRGG